MNCNKKTLADFRHGIVFFIGWLLSPLSWWNDLVVNVPIAYLFAQAIALLDHRLFVYAFVVGYWLTNVCGFLLMHQSAARYLKTPETGSSLIKIVLISFGYTLLIILLAHFKFIASPAAFLKQLPLK